MHILTAYFIASLAGPSATADSTHCKAAAQFLRTEQHMVAKIDADTIDDWRTRTRMIGCRVTAAGGTNAGVQPEAVRFYERLRAAKWVRTPDPRDSPNEASLRFRWENSDCLFNINADALLGTESEGEVNERLRLKPGETRYQVVALCMAAKPAAPRE